MSRHSIGLPVGDAPQTQVGASVRLDVPAGFTLSMDWHFNDRMYADFDPVSRTDPSDRSPSYRLPSYHLLGGSGVFGSPVLRGHHASEQDDGRSATAGRDFRECRLTVFVTGANLLDSFYIERGKDGSSHDLTTFRGYWGFGRNFTFGLRFSL